MWEAIVEKLLTRYLSEYVDGIEREKLQVGLLRGNVELTDLTLKPEAAESFDVPFSLVYGRIGKLIIGISWSRWMAGNYDLRVTIEDVHILLRPRVPTHEKSAAELRQELRAAKERTVFRQETHLLEALRAKDGTTSVSRDASFLMKLSNRLLRNIELEVRGIHISFHDATREFSIGCLLDRGSLFSCDKDGTKTSVNMDENIVSKTVESEGLSVYGGTSAIHVWKDIIGAANTDKIAAKIKATKLLYRIQASLPSIVEPQSSDSAEFPQSAPTDKQSPMQSRLSSGSLSSKPSGASSMETPLSASTLMSPRPASLLLSTRGVLRQQFQERFTPSHSQKCDPNEKLKNFDYILLPLHMTFSTISNMAEKLVTATYGYYNDVLSCFLYRLDIGKTSQGVAISRSQLRTILDLTHEASLYRRSCQQLLLSGAHLVRLDPEGLQHVTKSLFTKIYAKKLQYDLDLPRNKGPLNPLEIERLNLLQDVVPIRHLAKWRAACMWDIEKAIAAGQSIVQKKLAEARQQQSWWNWATQGSRVVENAVLEKIQQTEGIHALLTEDESAFMSTVVMVSELIELNRRQDFLFSHQTEISTDGLENPTIFKLSFNLPHLSFVLHDHSARMVQYSPQCLTKFDMEDYSNHPFVALSLMKVRATFLMRTSIDRNDKEIWEWVWSFAMTDFCVKHRRDNIISFNKQESSLSNLGQEEVAQPPGFSEVHRPTRDIWTSNDPIPVSTEKASLKVQSDADRSTEMRPVTIGVESPQRMSLQELAAAMGLKIGQWKDELGQYATRWEFLHEATAEGNITSVFIRMSPLEIVFNPDLLQESLHFFMVETRRHALSQTQQSAPILDDNLEAIVAEDQFFFDMFENVERLRAAATQKVPDLVRIDVELCAPILFCNSPDGRKVIMHFGQLKVFTDGYCRYSDIRFTVEMNETKITCVGDGGKMIPLLRPVPIRVHVVYLPATFSVSLDAVFYEVFIEINPEALLIMLAVQSTLAWSIIKGRVEAGLKGKEGISCTESEGSSTAPDIITDERLLGPSTEATADAIHAIPAVEFEDQSGGGRESLDEEEAVVEVAKSQFNVSLEVSVARVGFSLINTKGQEVLRVAVVNMFLSGAITPMKRIDITTVPFKVDLNCQLEAIFISDPHSRNPLFLTLLESEDYVAEREDQLFGRVEVGIRQANLKDIQMPHECATAAEASSRSLEHHHDGTSTSSNSVDFEDVRDDWTLQVTYCSEPVPLIVLNAAACVLHWHKPSVQQIIKAYQELKCVIAEAVESQMQLLRLNVRELIDNMGSDFVHPTALATLESALIYVKSSIVPTPVMRPAEAFPTTPAASAPPSSSKLDGDHPVVTHGLDSNGVLPPFADNNEKLILQCELNVSSAGLYFWQGDESLACGELVNVSACYQQFASGDANLNFDVGDVHVNMNERYILSSSGLEESKGREAEQEGEDVKPNDKPITTTSASATSVFSAAVKFYTASCTASRPYSACFSGRMSRISYVYFQKDLNLILTYLTDGILDAVLWKSYEAAMSLASSSYFLFSLEVDRPLFILPEDKSTIPQLLTKAEPTNLNDPIGHNNCPKNSSMSVCHRKSSWSNRHVTCRVATNYLGCYVALDLGRLHIKNAYTLRPIAVSRTEEAEGGEVVNLSSARTTSIFLAVEGISAAMFHSLDSTFFTSEVTGPILEQVSIDFKMRCGDPFLVDLHVSDLKLYLKRQQLTLFLDIMNENFAGLGYHPSAIELQPREPTVPVKSEENIYKLQQGIRINVTENENVDEEVRELLNTQPLRISVRMEVDSLHLDVAFSQSCPLGYLHATTIFICCDVSLYPLYMTYQFNLVGESVVIDDQRQNSRNVYKRFLECLPSNRATCPTINKAPLSHMNYSYNEVYRDGLDPPGTTFHWMRPGADIKMLDTNLFGPDKEFWLEQDQTSQSVFDHCLSLTLGSSLKENIFEVVLTDPSVYVFTVGMQDILDWVLSAYGFSTLRRWDLIFLFVNFVVRYPKPTPAVLTSNTKGGGSATRDAQIKERVALLIPQTKIFLIDVSIYRGIFHLFSNIEQSDEPILQWQNDLKFVAESGEDSFVFKSIKISDCRVTRVDIVPEKQSDIISEQATLSSCGFSHRSSRLMCLQPLFTAVSNVVLCKSFGVSGSGSMDTLYDPIQYYQNLAASQRSNPAIPTDAPEQIRYLAMPKYQTGKANVDMRQRTCRLMGPNAQSAESPKIETPDPRKYYGNRTAALSQLQLDMTIPAFRSFHSDIPAASPGVPSPPIIPPTDLQSQPDISIPGNYMSLDDENLPDSNRFVGASFLGREPLRERDEETINTPPLWNEISIDRYCHFNLHFAGVSLTVFDDLRSAITPVLRTEIGMDKLSFHLSPKHFLAVVTALQTCVHYVSPRAGDWEPFIERFNISVRFQYYDEEVAKVRCPATERLDPISPTDTSAKASLSQTSESPSKSKQITVMRIPGQPNIAASPFTSSLTGSKASQPPSLSPEWLRFQPTIIIHLESSTPLWVNVTPQLCQLLLWFVPTLVGYVTAASLVSDKPPNQITPPLTKAIGASGKFEEVTQSLSELGVASQVPTVEDGIEVCDTTSSYRYVNFTGHTFVAFTLREFNITPEQNPMTSSNTSVTPRIASIMRLVPCTSPRSLDQLSTQSMHRMDRQHLNVFIAPEPLANVVGRLQSVLPQCSRDMIMRSLMVTRDELKTRANLEHAVRIVKGSATLDINALDASPPFLGPFPRSMTVCVVSLSRNNAVLIPPALTRMTTHIPSSMSAQEMPHSSSSSEVAEDYCEESVDLLGCPPIACKSLIPEPHAESYPRDLCRTEPSYSECLAPGTIATVFSPHPSYKLCVLTSSVRVRNRSGLPIEIAFLDSQHRPIYLENIRNLSGPCSILEHVESPSRTVDATTATRRPMMEQQSSHPALHLLPESLWRLRDRNYGNYSIILPDSHFMSVPDAAFLKNQRVLLVFRPAILADAGETLSPLKRGPFSIRFDDGWTSILDTDDSRDTSRPRSYVRVSRYTPGVTTARATSIISPQRSLSSKDKRNYVETFKKDELFFTVVRTDTPSALPSEQPIICLNIYPSITIVNACPVPMDVELIGESKTHPIESPLSRPLPTASFFQTFNAPEVAKSEPLHLTLLPHRVFHVYACSPAAHGASLSIRLRLGLDPLLDWSSNLRFNHTPSKEDVISRLMIPCHGAKFEVEVYKDPCDFANFVPGVEVGQQACALSCPRWFVDQSGLGVVVFKTGTQKPFPKYGKVTLLGDSQEPDIELVLPGSALDPEKKYVVFFNNLFDGGAYKQIFRGVGGIISGVANIASVGSHSHFHASSPNNYLTFALQTTRISPADVAGTLSRCISLVPQYLITNKLDVDLLLRQSNRGVGSQRPICRVPVGETRPMHWAIKTSPLLFEFRPGESEGYTWSGPVEASEAYVGGTNIALNNGNTPSPVIFNVQIIPDNGIICAVIRKLEDSPECAAIVLTNRLKTTVVAVTALHLSHGSEDLDMKYYANPEETVTLAWPFPFTEKVNIATFQLFQENNLLGSKTTKFNPYDRQEYLLRVLVGESRQSVAYIQIATRGNILRMTIFQPHIRGDFRTVRVHALKSESEESVVAAVDALETRKNMQVTISLSQVGLSLVSDRRREELLFAEASTCLLIFLHQADDQLFELRLNDIQIDSQLESSSRPVLLANKGGLSNSSYSIPPLSFWSRIKSMSHIAASPPSPTPRATTVAGVEASFFSPKPVKPSTSFASGIAATMRHDGLVAQPPRRSKSSKNIAAKSPVKEYGYRPSTPDTLPAYCIYLWAERESLASIDLHIKKFLLVIDDFEIDIDGEMLTGLTEFADECLDIFGGIRSSGTPKDVVFQRAGCPTHVNFQLPPLGLVIVLDTLTIQKFTMTVRCSFFLDKVGFISDIVKIALRIMMMSQKLELKGAPLVFAPETIDSTHRGSFGYLMNLLKTRYTDQMISSIGTVVGYSSLLTIPRAPLELVRGTVGVGLSFADNLSSGIGSVLTNLTFDTNYINQRQKERNDPSNQPTGLKEGLNSASKDFKEGFRHLGDIVTKPVGGVQKDGFAGFMKGIGKGVVGSVFKPVDKLGSVVSNVASGLRAEYVTKPLGGYKYGSLRRRKPRMLWGDMGKIREYDVSEAELRECLGLKMAKNVSHSVSVSVREATPAQHLAILIYPKSLCYVDLYAGRGRAHRNAEEIIGDSSSSSSAVVGRANIDWSCQLADVTHIRASSHGVAIHTHHNVYQIACVKGVVIKKLCEEIAKAERHVKTEVEIGKLADWVGSDQIG